MRKRILSVLLVLSLTLSLLPVGVWAAEQDDTGFCPHHTEHTQDCGYIPADEGAPCTHEHTQACYALTETCDHEHDEACGYADGTDGVPCGYVCEICEAAALETEMPEDAEAPTTGDPALIPADEPQAPALIPADEPQAPAAIVADEPKSIAEEHDHSSGWTELIDGTTTLEDGSNYYLDDDVTLTGTITVSGEATLCLNGRTLNLNNLYYIHVLADGKLTLDDCGEGGKITGGATGYSYSGSYYGGAVYVEGAFIMDGGEISGNMTQYGGGVGVYGGTFIMNNGTIDNNTANNDKRTNSSAGGGGVFVTNKGAFTMNSGTISKNKVSHTRATNLWDAELAGGGGVHVAEGTFIMEKGTISENESAGFGGGVNLASGTFTMNNGTISDNKSDYVSGGVYADQGSFTMAGGTISGNHAGEEGGGVEVYLAQFTMSDGEITDNKAEKNGGGVYVSSPKGTFTMNGGTISENQAGTYGGGVCLPTGTFTMTNGTISKNTAGQNGGGVYVKSPITFTMSGGEISENTAQQGGGVFVCPNATFTMDDGTISKNKATGDASGLSKYGGGVEVLGTFTMSGGEISENTAAYGGGVDVTNEGTFTMSSGTISANTADQGGGVYVYGSTFTMEDGTITGNKATADYGYGGGVCVDFVLDSTDSSDRSTSSSTPGANSIKSTFTMENGTISDNTALTCGGGVEVRGSTFTMENGTISGNSSTTYGGGVAVTNGGTFTMTDGTISGNTAETSYGGGVAVTGSSEFTMESGTISGNTAETVGGGVTVMGTFTMTGGTISGNTAETSYGGGVAATSGGTFTMTDGKISGNTAETYGGGVYVSRTGTFQISGSPVVTENRSELGNGEDNVCLSDNSIITVVGQLTDADIGVTLPVNASANTHEGVFTTGYQPTHKDTDPKTFFTYNGYYSSDDYQLGQEEIGEVVCWDSSKDTKDNDSGLVEDFSSGEAGVLFTLHVRDTKDAETDTMTQRVFFNRTAVQSELPSLKSGYIWSDANTGAAFDFGTKFLKNFTVYQHDPNADERGGGEKGNEPDGIPDDQEIIVIYQIEPDPQKADRGDAGVLGDDGKIITRVEVFDLRETDYKPGDTVTEGDVDPKGVAIANDGYVFWKWTIDDEDDDEYKQEVKVREQGNGTYYGDDEDAVLWDDLADFYGKPTVGHVYIFTAYFHSLRHQLNDYGTILPDDDVFEAIPEISREDLESIKVELSASTKNALLKWVKGDDNDFNHDEGAKNVGGAYWPDEVDIHVQIKVDIEDVRYYKTATADYTKKLEMDITPYFQVAAAVRDIADVEDPVAGEHYVILSEGVEGADEEGWIEIPVTYPVEMVIPMPVDFAKDGDTVKVEHLKDGKIVRSLTLTVADGAVKFTDINGFSTFIFTVVPEEPSNPKPNPGSGSGGGTGGSGNGPTITTPSKPTPDGLNITDHFAYISGYPDGTVRPRDNITRAEVAAIFFRLLTEEVGNKYWSTANNYPDVAADSWYNTAISTLSNMGIISGYPDGTFRPNASITRAEFVNIAVSFFHYTDQASTNRFSDIAGHWAERVIRVSAAIDLVSGYPDGTFRPDNYITRAEAISIINRELGRKPHVNGMYASMIIWPDNMDKSVWYYEDVQEATNAHEYSMDLRVSGDREVYERWTKALPEMN